MPHLQEHLENANQINVIQKQPAPPPPTVVSCCHSAPKDQRDDIFTEARVRNGVSEACLLLAAHREPFQAHHRKPLAPPVMIPLPTHVQVGKQKPCFKENRTLIFSNCLLHRSEAKDGSTGVSSG